MRMMIPIPPSHSISDRHHCSVAGSWLGCRVTVSPVPVMPLTPSKTALLGERNARSVGLIDGGFRTDGPMATVHAISANGSALSTPTISHTSAADANAWAADVSSALLVAYTRIEPILKTTMIERSSAGMA